jgi:hypothetical protein
MVSVAPVTFGVVGFVFTVSVVPVVELEELNVALVLDGSPLTENVTALLNPFTGTTAIAYVVDCLAVIVRLVGVDVSEKLD